MSPRESQEFDKRESERQARLDDTTIMKTARAFTRLAYDWLQRHGNDLAARKDDVLREAVEVAAHDAAFVSAKLNRALDGKDRVEHDGEDDHPVQNDWNGSAKVALISWRRPEEAWRMIAHATRDDTPLPIADQLNNLQREVENAFPKAWSFLRPGFDEPGR